MALNTHTIWYSSLCTDTRTVWYSSLCTDTHTIWYSSLCTDTHTIWYSSLCTDTHTIWYSSLCTDTHTIRYSSLCTDTHTIWYSSLCTDTHTVWYSSLCTDTHTIWYSSLCTDIHIPCELCFRSHTSSSRSSAVNKEVQTEDLSLLCCDTALLSVYVTTFQKITVPLSAEWSSPERVDVNCLTLTMKALWSFRILMTAHPTTQCHILEDLGLQGCDTPARTSDLEKLVSRCCVCVWINTSPCLNCFVVHLTGK